MTRELLILFTIDELAARLHKSRRWLQAFLRGRDIGRLAGRTRLFTEGDVARLIQELPCPSSSSRPGKTKARIGQSAARISGGTLIEALALASERLPPRSSRILNGKSRVVDFPNAVNRRLRAPQRPI
jgi:hypothetical protein